MRSSSRRRVGVPKKQRQLLLLRSRYRIRLLDDVIRETVFDAIRKTSRITLAAQLLRAGKTSLYRYLRLWQKQGHVKLRAQRAYYVVPPAKRAAARSR